LKKLLFPTIILIFIWFTSAFSQESPGIAPGAIQKRSTGTSEYYELEKKLKEEKRVRPGKEIEVQEEKEEKAPLPDQKEILFINKIVTGPSEILSETELRGITKEYEGKPASVKDLFEIVDKINALYKAKNFITAKAILPPQKVEAGVVYIRLIEAHVGKISIENNPSTRDSYFTSRISQKTGDLVNVKELEKDVVFFNRTGDVNIKAELKPGAQTGTTDFILKAEEPPRYQVLAYADNAGREEVGRERIGMRAEDRSLFGYRDVLMLNMLGSDGTVSVNASYNIPFGETGTSIGGNFDFSRITYEKGPLTTLEIDGESKNFGFRLTQPVAVEENYKIDGYVGFNRKASNTDFDQVRLFETIVNEFVAGCNYQAAEDNGAWQISQYVTIGKKNEGDDRDFITYNLQAGRLLRFNNEIAALFRGGLQLSDSKLLPSFEQFQIGGTATVRGYTEGLLSGDNGYFLSAELNFPFLAQTCTLMGIPLRDKIKGFIFLDHGGAFPYKGDDQSIDSDDFLTGAGFGLIFNFSKYLSGKMICGIPLSKPNGDVEDAELHFYFQSNLL